ncbi:hypothetical protein Tco_0640255 [Tanacetum coccineum]
MDSNLRTFKCLIHYNEIQRGAIMSEDLTYSSLNEMMMKKFKFESNSQINLSFKLSSFDCNVDITDDAEKVTGAILKFRSKESHYVRDACVIVARACSSMAMSVDREFCRGGLRRALMIMRAVHSRLVACLDM